MGSLTDDPLVAYDELVLSGQPPDVASFCAQFPNHPDLEQRIHALAALRHDLVELVAPEHRGESVPAAIPGFEIIGLLGQGGMGTVYAARQLEPRRLCALKVMHGASPAARARFRREADTAARLRHPGIATVYAFGEHAGQAYLTSELIPGVSLRQVLRVADYVEAPAELWLVQAAALVGRGVRPQGPPTRPLPVAVAVDVARQMADALAEAHAHGVIHRDVKPSNAMVALDATIKLIDFGIAIADDIDGSVTQLGVFVGSHDYAAPEQLSGERQRLGPWTDVYSLGATLFEMLAQRTPFEAPSFADRVATLRAPPPRHVAAFNPGVSRALDRVVARCLEPEPDDRFADAAELRDALSDLDRGHVLSLPLPRWSLSRRALIGIAACAIGLATLGFGLYAGVRRQLTAAQQHTAVLERRLERGHKEEMYAVLGEHRAALLACVPPPKAHPLVRVTPHFDAILTVAGGYVTSVDVTPFSTALGDSVKTCMKHVLEGLTLPGVGLGASERIPVSIDVTLPGHR